MLGVMYRTCVLCMRWWPSPWPGCCLHHHSRKCLKEETRVSCWARSGSSGKAEHKHLSCCQRWAEEHCSLLTHSSVSLSLAAPGPRDIAPCSSFNRLRYETRMSLTLILDHPQRVSGLNRSSLRACKITQTARLCLALLTDTLQTGSRLPFERPRATARQTQLSVTRDCELFKISHIEAFHRSEIASHRDTESNGSQMRIIIQIARRLGARASELPRWDEARWPLVERIQ